MKSQITLYSTLDSRSVHFIHKLLCIVVAQKKFALLCTCVKYFYILQLKWVWFFQRVTVWHTYVNKINHSYNTLSIQQNTYKTWASETFSYFLKHSWQVFLDTMGTLTGFLTLTIDQSQLTQCYESLYGFPIRVSDIIHHAVPTNILHLEQLNMPCRWNFEIWCPFQTLWNTLSKCETLDLSHIRCFLVVKKINWPSTFSSRLI